MFREAQIGGLSRTFSPRKVSSIAVVNWALSGSRIFLRKILLHENFPLYGMACTHNLCRMFNVDSLYSAETVRPLGLEMHPPVRDQPTDLTVQ